MKKVKRFIGRAILKIYDLLNYKFSVLDIIYFIVVVALSLTFVFSIVWALDHSPLYGI